MFVLPKLKEFIKPFDNHPKYYSMTHFDIFSFLDARIRLRFHEPVLHIDLRLQMWFEMIEQLCAQNALVTRARGICALGLNRPFEKHRIGFSSLPHSSTMSTHSLPSIHSTSSCTPKVWHIRATEDCTFRSSQQLFHICRIHSSIQIVRSLCCAY